MSSGEKFGDREIFKIFVVGDDINRRSQTFEVVSPNFEGFKNHKSLLVVNVIVELWSGEGPRVESDRMYFRVVWRHD